MHNTKVNLSQKIKVYDPKELYEALFPYSEEDQYVLDDNKVPKLDENGNKIYKPVKHEILILKKKESHTSNKKTSNCDYINVFVKLPSDEVANPLILKISDVLITKRPIDFKDPTDKRNEYLSTELKEPTTNTIETTRDESGYYGKCINKLNEAWLYNIDVMRKSKQIIVNKDKKICSLLQLEYGEKAPKDLANTPIPNPPIRFKVDFTKYPATYSRSFMRNKPKTVINDWSQRYMTTMKDGTQKEIAPPATVFGSDGNKEELTVCNMYRFVTPGSMIVYGRVHLESAIISSLAVSMPQVLGLANIEPSIDEGGFEGEEDVLSSLKIETLNTKDEEVENIDPNVMDFLNSVQ